MSQVAKPKHERRCPNGHIQPLRRSEWWFRGALLAYALNGIVMGPSLAQDKVPAWVEGWPDWSLQVIAISYIGSIILIGVAHYFSSKTWTCPECGHTEKDPRPPLGTDYKLLIGLVIGVLALVLLSLAALVAVMLTEAQGGI